MYRFRIFIIGLSSLNLANTRFRLSFLAREIGRDDLFASLFWHDSPVSASPLTFEFTPFEQSIEKDSKSCDFGMRLIRDCDIEIGARVDIEWDLFGPNDHEQRFVLRHCLDLFFDCLYWKSVHCQMNNRSFERLEEPIRFISQVNGERTSKAVGNVIDGIAGARSTISQNHAVGSECARGESNVGRHPVIPSGSMTKSEDGYFVFSHSTLSSGRD